MKATLLVLMAGCGSVMSPNPNGGDDDTMHPPGVLYGSVLDERGDTIDFSTGEPVHTHAGPPIDIASGCPAVWKYTYLAGEQAPVFGKETTPNPFAWHLESTSGDVAYRVRRDDGTVLLDWTAATATTGNVYDIVLHRDGAHGLPQLADTTTMYLDARIGGSDGAVQSACWHNEPLAPPLAFVAPEPSDLFSMSLAMHSPISEVVNGAVDVTQYRFSQLAGEQVRLRIFAAQPSGAFSKLVKTTFVSLGSVTPPAGSCDDSGDCSRPEMVPSMVMSDGVLAGTWTVRVEDAITGSSVCDDQRLDVTCTIAPRLVGEEPHPYRIVVKLAHETALSVGPATAEQAIPSVPTAVHYTGLAPVTAGYYYCDSPHVVMGHPVCLAATQWVKIVGLEHASVQIDPIDLDIHATTSDDAGIVPPYLAPGALTFPARAWDAGNAGL